MKFIDIVEIIADKVNYYFIIINQSDNILIFDSSFNAVLIIYLTPKKTL